MTIETAPATAASEASFTLDPFGFFPTRHSRIKGLGGLELGPDPSYVLHTPYADCGTGPALWVVNISNLTATSGTLVLRLHVVPADLSANAKVIKTAQMPLPELVERDGTIALQVEAKRGFVYALFGYIGEVTDAAADALTIDVHPSESGTVADVAFAELPPTSFGRDAAVETPRLLASGPVRLAVPVSQPCTAGQLAEPAFDHWLATLGQAPARTAQQWRFVYILQALRTYGMLEDGARGLGFGAAGEPLPEVLAAAGCAVTLVAQRVAEAEEEVEVTADDGVRRIDDLTALPSDLAGFDFAWSTSVVDRLGSIAAGRMFVEQAMNPLKLGGFAIHTFDYSFDSGDPAPAGHIGAVFRRGDVERLALSLIAAGHEVAQIKYDCDADGAETRLHLGRNSVGEPVTAFGIIARKGG